MLAKVVHGGPRVAVYFLVQLRPRVPAAPGSQGTGEVGTYQRMMLSFILAVACACY